MPFYKHTYFFRILIFFVIFAGTELNGHGFGASTLVKAADKGWRSIEQLCLLSCRNTQQKIASYELRTHNWVTEYVTSVGQSEANCYIKIGFGNSRNDIICTPTQEFFLSASKQWIPAYQLHVGDLLLCQRDKTVYVAHIEFIQEPIKIYSLEIKNTHNFFVSSHSVLTHNMVLPMALSVGLSVPFGTVVGGAIGSFFGPIAVTLGIGVGIIAGLTVKAIYEDDIPTYKTPEYDVTFFNQHVASRNSTDSTYAIVTINSDLSGAEIKSDSYFHSENPSKSEKDQRSGVNFPSPKMPKKDDDKGKNAKKDRNKDRPTKTRMTAKQARIEAKRLGYKETNYYSNGQPVFKKGNRYITPDVDSHNGGIWKMADSIKGLEHKSTRTGTYDANLNRIGD